MWWIDWTRISKPHSSECAQIKCGWNTAALKTSGVNNGLPYMVPRMDHSSQMASSDIFLSCFADDYKILWNQWPPNQVS